MVAHILKRIVAHITEEFDAWFHAPVPLVFIHQRLTEEEAGLEATHVSVAGRVSVDDLPLSHVRPDLSRLPLVNEVGKRPMFVRNLAIIGFPRDKCGGDPFKFGIKWFVIEEHPIIMIISIEAILHHSNGLDDIP